MSGTGHLLGVYEDISQLDHDAEILVEQSLDDLSSRGVARSYALAAIQRIVRGLK